MQRFSNIFLAILYGFRMFFYKNIYEIKYANLFIFRRFYRFALSLLKLEILACLILAYVYYWYYRDLPLSLIYSYGMFTFLTFSFCCYTIGLYAIYPIKLEQSQLYQMLLNEFEQTNDSFLVNQEYSYYGLAVLLQRFDKAGSNKYEEIQKLISQLSTFTAIEEELSSYNHELTHNNLKHIVQKSRQVNKDTSSVTKKKDSESAITPTNSENQHNKATDSTKSATQPSSTNYDTDTTDHKSNK